MLKTSFDRTVRRKVLLLSILSCAVGVPVLAQNAKPAPSIGAAPANSKQHKILDAALSPETRQTLQTAMNSTGSK